MSGTAGGGAQGLRVGGPGSLAPPSRPGRARERGGWDAAGRGRTGASGSQPGSRGTRGHFLPRAWRPRGGRAPAAAVSRPPGRGASLPPSGAAPLLARCSAGRPPALSGPRRPRPESSRGSPPARRSGVRRRGALGAGGDRQVCLRPIHFLSFPVAE